MNGAPSWPRTALWLLLLSHFVIWTLQPILANNNIPLDTAEITIMGREFAWGYHNHPPLPAWTANLVHWLAGPYLAAAALSAACQIAVIATLWLVWRLAQGIMPPSHAFLSVLLLETTSYYSWVTREWNHSLQLMPLVALAVLSFERALRTQQLWPWALVGLSFGLGGLCKYSIGLVGLSMLAFIVLHPRARLCLRTPGPYLAAAVAALVLLPHLLWLIEQGFPTLRYVARRASVNSTPWWQNLPAFVGGQFLYLGLFWAALLSVLVVPWKLRKLDQGQRETRALLVTVTLGPAVILMLMSFLTGRALVTAWVREFLILIGVLMVFSFETSPQFKRSIIVCGAIAILTFTGTMLADTIGPCLSHRGERVHFPGRFLAERIEAEWRRRFDSRLAMVAGDRWIADNVAFYAPDRPRALVYDIDLVSYPESRRQEMFRSGGVLLWNADSHGAELPAFLQPDFPGVHASPPLEVGWKARCAVPPLHIGVAFIPPTNAPFVP